MESEFRDLFPLHGWIACTRCAPTGYGHRQEFGFPGGWRLTNKPAAWGSSNPVVAVLGFSRGSNQSRCGIPFDDIAFHGMRDCLTDILRSLKLLHESDHVRHKITASERDFAFGSLLRCSASLDGRKSGDIIKRFSREPEAAPFFMNCADQFLSLLPPRLRLIVMLGNDDGYIRACQDMMRCLHPDIVPKGRVAYGTEATTWVHVVHPSPACKSHQRDWLSGTDNTQGAKGEQARWAARQSGAYEALRMDM